MAWIHDRLSRVAVPAPALVPSAMTIVVTLLSIGVSIGVFAFLSLVSS
jgi:hypothetical protein